MGNKHNKQKNQAKEEKTCSTANDEYVSKDSARHQEYAGDMSGMGFDENNKNDANANAEILFMNTTIVS